MLKDVFAILETTPEKIRRELAALSPRQMKARPAANKWSVQEILAHLDDVEENAMRMRVSAILEQVNPVLEPFNQEARVVERRYDRKDPRRTLAALTRKRRENLKWLRKLRPAQLKRRGVHRQVGEISVEDFLHEWAFHDLGHLKQILEVKRYALYPRMGNMRAFYQLT